MITKREIQTKQFYVDDIPVRYIDEYYYISQKFAVTGLRIHRSLDEKGFIFYLPGRWQNSKDWTINNQTRDLRYYFLANGYSVATMDYRTNFVDQYNISIEEIQNWDMGTFIDDIQETLAILVGELNFKSICLIGFSMGAAFSYLLSKDTYKKYIKGLIVLDGGIKSPDFKAEFDLQQFMEGMSIPSENPAWERTFRRKALCEIHEYKLNKYKQTNIDLTNLLITGNRYWPSIQVLESRALADYEQHPTLGYDKDLKEIDIPILCVMAITGKDISGNVILHRAVQTAILTSSRDIETIMLVDWDHMDILAREDVENQVLNPALEWMERFVQ